MKNAKGFTLIELVSVIVILGILATTTVGVFSKKESYEPTVVANQLIASLHGAQQLALSRQNLTTAVPVSLIIGQTADDWTFNLWERNPATPGNVAFDTANVERSNTTLRFSTSDFVTACSGLSASTSYTITYDGVGSLLSSSRLRICVVGDQTIQICITTLGFAYEGSTCL